MLWVKMIARTIAIIWPCYPYLHSKFLHVIFSQQFTHSLSPSVSSICRLRLIQKTLCLRSRNRTVMRINTCRGNNQKPINVCSSCCFNHNSEEHTSELQSQSNLVCRLLLEKKKKHKTQ